MNSPIIAAQLYSFHDFTKEISQLADTFSKIKQIGYDYAQISGVGAPISANDLRKIMLDNGVTPIGVHIGLDLWLNDFSKAINDCHGYGVQYAAIPWLNFNNYKSFTIDQWMELFRQFNDAAVRAKQEGVILQYHNHDFEFNQLGIQDGKDGKAILEILFDSCPDIQAEPDFGWVVRGGYDPILWAKRMNGRMDQVHLKDWSLIDGEFSFRALGQGRINWPAIITECQKGGTHTFIVEQDSCRATNDPFKSLAISREYLKSFFV